MPKWNITESTESKGISKSSLAPPRKHACFFSGVGHVVLLTNLRVITNLLVPVSSSVLRMRFLSNYI